MIAKYKAEHKREQVKVTISNIMARCKSSTDPFGETRGQVANETRFYNMLVRKKGKSEEEQRFVEWVKPRVIARSKRRAEKNREQMRLKTQNKKTQING